MKIQILGTGCPKCTSLAENARKAIEELGIDAEVVKVTELNDILAFGVMMTPALAIENEVKKVGKLLTVEEIKELLS